MDTRAGLAIAVAVAVAAAAAVAGCGPAAPAAGEPTAPPPRRYRRGPIGRVVVPAALGDPGVLDRIPYGAHVLRYGMVELALGAGPIGRDEPIEATYDRDATWPVIAESGDRVQVVSAVDSAHLGLWVLRDDLATVAIDDVVVGAHPGAVPAPSGGVVELRSGAQVAVAATDRTSAASRIELDAEVSIAGWVPATAVGKVFTIRPDETLPDADHQLLPGAVIRAAAGPSAPVLAIVRRAVGVALTPPSTVAPGWAEVRAILPYARIRGFVATDQLANAGPEEQFGEGGGGWGIGGRISMPVPPGVCLYAAPDGEVVGVTVDDLRNRLVTAAEPPGWWNAIVSTDWGLLEVYLRDAPGNRDVAKAQLESCLEPGPPIGDPLTH